MSAPDTFIDRNGLVWMNGGEETDDHLAFGGHEPNLIAMVPGFLPKDGVFLDVGAHVGLWSLNLARERASAVIAVEANPLTYGTLKQNIEVNAEVLHGFVSAHNVAAWDEVADLALVDHNGRQTGGSTRCSPDLTEGNVPFRAHGMPLDDWVKTPVDFVKIDVEGAEARVLKGMKDILERDRPNLFVEMHDMYFGPQIRDDVFEQLFARRYTWNEDVKFGGGYYLIAQPTEKIADSPEPVTRADEGVTG